MPANFAVQDLTPGLWFYVPTCLAYLPDGRLLVGEKRGNVYLVKDGVKVQTPLWSRESEVLDSGDCGLMSIAVGPDFFQDHFVYLLYTADPDSDGSDEEQTAFGRLVRYRMSAADTNTFDLASRTVLLGADWAHGPLVGFGSHTVGSLRFGRDGSLLMGAGDGGSAGAVDAGGFIPEAFGPGRTDPSEDIGAFRAQDPNSLCGKILRLDPATGNGLPTNPFYDGDGSSNASRVWQLGLRNPFRFSTRPGTGAAGLGSGDPGTLYVGDVGWLTWEEIDVAREGGNDFGWPCNEGPFESTGYRAAHPAAYGCATLGAPVDPIAWWHHTDPALSSPPGAIGNCAIGGVFYTAASYPAQYQGRYFFGDFGGDWLAVANIDSLDHLVSVEPFGTDLGYPTDFAVDPVTGDVVYVSIGTGEVRRIRYIGFHNLPPVASVAATPTAGLKPLLVSFDGRASHDPEGGTLDFLWSFGDGALAAGPTATHSYTTGGRFAAYLTVTDEYGARDRDTVTVTVADLASFPATPVRDDFNRGDGPVGGSWTNIVSSLAVSGGALIQTGSPSPFGTWSGATFGGDQEAYLTLTHIVSQCRRYCLLLELQNGAYTNGGIEVRYDPTVSTVQVATYQPGIGTKLRGTLYPVTFADGDRFGARVMSDGTVSVYRNQTVLGQVSLGNWGFTGAGGKIGIDLAGAAGSRLDDFGGGTLPSSDQAPLAVIATPVAPAFSAVGDTVRLVSAASDPDDPAAALAQRWQVDLHHNNHVHPSFFVSTKPSDAFVMGDHDDGTGVWYDVALYVTDPAGQSDTAHVAVYPQVDLAAAIRGVTPETPQALSPATCTLVLRNLGGSHSPRFHWTLSADDLIVAAGDTLVAARDSVVLVRDVPAVLEAGTHLLTLRADADGIVVEPDEANDVATRTLVVTPVTGDATPPRFTNGPTSEPYGTHSWIRWRASEPVLGEVCFGTVRTALADSVPAPVPPDTARSVLLPSLAPATRYYFRVTMNDAAGNPTVAPLDSFTTLNGPLAAEDPPPARFALGPARPNPARAGTTLELALPRAAHVRFAVFDALGREVWNGPDAVLEAGRRTLRWPGLGDRGRPLPAGLYLARVQVDGRVLSRRIAMIR